MFKRKYVKEKLILYFFKVLIIAAFAGGMYFVWTRYYNPVVPVPFYRYGNYLLGVIFVAVYVGFVKVYDGFTVGTSTVSDLIFSQVIAIAFLVGFSYLIFSLLSYKMLAVWPFLVILLVFSLFAALWSVVVTAVYYKLHKPKKTIFVFNNIDSYLSLKGVRSMEQRFRVVRTVNSDKTSLEELYDYMKGVDAVFLCGVPSDYRNEVVKKCIAMGKAAYIKPKISDTILGGATVIQLMNIPVFRCKRSDVSLIYSLIKRTADIVFSLCALVVLSPLMLCVAAAVKHEDGGPVFYRQTRLTLNGKRFKIIKFRSMKVDAEKDGVARLAGDDDDRITKVGKVIRKLRLDEIPQLLNILSGDMSIVGPRPERPEIAKQYEESIPEFALRLQAKAGLTGYAQVYGKYNTPPYDKLQMDLMYVANQSVIEDIKLILMTLKVIFIPSSTEGVDENQKTAMRNDNESK